MRFVEKVAKTVDDAVTEALLELMATRDDVEIEILEKGSKGFLGLGARDAHVRVTVKEKEEEKSIFEELGIKKPHISLDEIEETEETEKTKQAAVVETAESVDPQAIAKNFLADVLVKMDIKAEIETSRVKEQIKINISGDKMGLLIGKRGENLDALQYLVNLVVNKNTEKYTRVILDTENYRQRREETLKKLAFRLAKKASQTKQKIVLEPMNPYDRRIIHSALQNSKTVKTHSDGREPYRKVVISPIDKGELNK